MYRTAYNPTASPVVVDDEGRMIGGREWGTYDTTEDAAKRALAIGTLIDVERPEDAASTDPRAVAAFGRTDEITERREQASALDKPTLLEVAENASISTPPNVGVADLRDALAERPEVPLPDAKPARKTTRKSTED